MRFLTIVAAGLLLVSLSACKKNIQTNDAVRDAVIQHLSKRTDLSLSGMTIEVSNVTFSENKATALISFVPKGATSAAGFSQRSAS